MSVVEPTASSRRSSAAVVTSHEGTPDAPPGRVTSEDAVTERYRSLFVIGKGGMGSVEVALERGAGGFERIVALKRMLPEGAGDARHKEMFLREARLAALLAHPNVVHAFAFGDLHGELFLAMEYVEGEPLSRVVLAARDKRGGLAPTLVAHVLAEVCDGLHAAHELRDVSGHALNVVHRDVSPHNVMIAYEGHVKLLDFGVAKFDAGQSNTKTGEVKGKIAYMSPEQAMGDPLDRRSDLFSIGAILFECLAGRRMWGQGTDLELMRKLALEDPPRLDTVMPEAPPALVELQARLVARDAKRRPASARAVAEELRAFIDATASRPDPRKVMDELFGEEAARQREALTHALQDAAPSRVEALRKSLEPSALGTAARRTRPTLLETEGTADPRDEYLARPAKRREPAAAPPRRWIAVGGVALLGAVTLGAAAWLSNHGAARSQPTTTVGAAPSAAWVAAPPTPSAADPGAEEPLASSSASTSASPRGTSTATTPPPATVTATARPTAVATVSPTVTAKPQRANVDPKPF